MTIFDALYQDLDYRPNPTSYLFERLPKSLHGLTVLDLGCGSGRNSMEALRRGAHVIAIDESRSGITALQKKAEREGVGHRLTATTGSIEKAVPAGINGLIMGTVLDHVDRPTARRMLGSLSPLLADDSWIYASVLTVLDPGVNGTSLSETSSELVHYWDPLDFFRTLTHSLSCMVVSANLDWKVDESHGPVHLHHIFRCLASKSSVDIGRPELIAGLG